MMDFVCSHGTWQDPVHCFLTRLLELVPLADLQHFGGLLLGGQRDLPDQELHEVLALFRTVCQIVQRQLPQTLVGEQNAAVLHQQEFTQLGSTPNNTRELGVLKEHS